MQPTLAAHSKQRPDADIYLPLPGIGIVLGAQVLGSFGGNPNAMPPPSHAKNYAGTSPLTIASGKKRAVLARHVRNRRLYDALVQMPSVP